MTGRETLNYSRRRVMVTGSRGWIDEDSIYQALDNLLRRLGPFELLHGGAEGADITAYWWALDHAGEVIGRTYLPDYKLHGAAAPHVRNDHMLKCADYVIAFWDGKSRGTKSVIDKALRLGIEYEVHAPEGVEIGV